MDDSFLLWRIQTAATVGCIVCAQIFYFSLTGAKEYVNGGVGGGGIQRPGSVKHQFFKFVTSVKLLFEN